MSRSTKKGPAVDAKLEKKIDTAIRSGKKTVIKTWARSSTILPQMVGLTIGVHDGGGTIRNSEGAVNEKEILWKLARWVDYSGAITNERLEGITLFDHPSNPNFPTYFHVRNDGWMGASLTFGGPREISPDETLHLRYGLYVHRDMKSAEDIQAMWQQFAQVQTLKK